MDKKEKLKGIIAGIVTVAVIGLFVWLMMVNLAIGIIVFVAFLGTMLGIALLKPANKPKATKVVKEIKDKEKLDIIINEIKKRTEMSYYTISLVEEPTDIYSSKVGGLPYWDLSKEYPIDSNGNKLILLAQINFEKENFDDERLPKKGLLQFFIGDNDLYGCNFDDVQNDWRIVYHEKIINGLNEKEIEEMNIPTNKTSELCPMEKNMEAVAIKFEKSKCYITTGTYNFENTVKTILKEKFNEEVTEKNLYFHFGDPDYEYIMNSFEAFGHKLLGYPDFTQSDPRVEDTKYDTLLLQIDTDKGIMWGDSGVCNFFINSEDLKKCNFSKVLYNWDCC